MTDTYYRGRVAVITGAGGTLCSEIAVDLAQKGANVVLIGRSADKLQKTELKIKAFSGSSMVRPCDVTDEAGMMDIAQEVCARWGACDFLINGAGGNQTAAMTTETVYKNTDGMKDARNLFDLDLDIFESVLKINTLGTVIPIRAFGKQMLDAGRGSIINFASMNSYCPLTRVPAYAMSKAAVANFTQWLGAYFGPCNVRVNAIAPGFFVNERSAQYLGTVEQGLTQRGKSVIDHTPMERFGLSRDLLGCVSWLLDERASAFVTGITVPLDGGFLARSGV
ncbi:SDR family NAD(P)-dependent oxidoreductase [Lachnotalea sp. AF33-28]|uniref:SDR family NAD(P)-dependent oxidoreductase n=1 Tax=Lachnotalea sp. AF33-28 TaxID=2292046 RepID=UPI000E543BEB|nr:SDR family NAD(P)-dependent oxidoreductase [Lachnotalea sp. AF33-28]RHP33946.1 SDR family NAD(P)-dependent oxidoreductase [Lachnotalea sp. AF33-28]